MTVQALAPNCPLDTMSPQNTSETLIEEIHVSPASPTQPLDPFHYTDKYQRLFFERTSNLPTNAHSSKYFDDVQSHLVEEFVSRDCERIKAVLPHSIQSYAEGLTKDLKRLSFSREVKDEEIPFYIIECALYYADTPYNSDLIEFLLTIYPNILNEGDNKSYILVNAIKANASIEHIKILLTHVKNKQAFIERGIYDEKPFKIAYKNARDDVMVFLVECGANFRNTFRSSSEAIMFIQAACEGKLWLVRFFCRMGFPLDYQQKENKDLTALHYASDNKQKEIISFLLVEGADPKVQNNLGETYLEYTRRRDIEFHDIAKNGILDLLMKRVYTLNGELKDHVDDLLDVNAIIDEKGNTLLHIATRERNDYGTVQYLRNRKADFTLLNNRNVTPFENMLKNFLSTRYYEESTGSPLDYYKDIETQLKEEALLYSIDFQEIKKNIFERDRLAREKLTKAIKTGTLLTDDEINDCSFDIVELFNKNAQGIDLFALVEKSKESEQHIKIKQALKRYHNTYRYRAD